MKTKLFARAASSCYEEAFSGTSDEGVIDPQDERELIRLLGRHLDTDDMIHLMSLDPTLKPEEGCECAACELFGDLHERHERMEAMLRKRVKKLIDDGKLDERAARRKLKWLLQPTKVRASETIRRIDVYQLEIPAEVEDPGALADLHWVR